MIHQINFQLQVFFLIWLLAFGQSWDYTLYIKKKKAFLYTIYSGGTYTDMTPPNITGTLIF